VVVVEDAGVGWVPLEKLEYMEGPWRTEDGTVLVSVGDRGKDTPLWRLTVEWVDGHSVVCSMYEALQYSEPPTEVLPWRLGYCRGRELDPSGPALATRVTILRAPGQAYLRIILGRELDADVYQVQ
jgi:hypothetical protein